MSLENKAEDNRSQTNQIEHRQRPNVNKWNGSKRWASESDQIENISGHSDDTYGDLKVDRYIAG
jgi:hypothetical protein